MIFENALKGCSLVLPGSINCYFCQPLTIQILERLPFVAELWRELFIKNSHLGQVGFGLALAVLLDNVFSAKPTKGTLGVGLVLRFLCMCVRTLLHYGTTYAYACQQLGFILNLPRFLWEKTCRLVTEDPCDMVDESIAFPEFETGKIRFPPPEGKRDAPSFTAGSTSFLS